MASTSPIATPLFFFFNDTATTEIYTLSLHDALPILARFGSIDVVVKNAGIFFTKPFMDYTAEDIRSLVDRKSTRLNSSHLVISYAVFCLKKKNNTKHQPCALPLETQRHQRETISRLH